MRKGCCAVPGSVALPFSVTGRPHSVVMSGPAFTMGGRSATFTVKVVVLVSPVTSVAVRRAV